MQIYYLLLSFTCILSPFTYNCLHNPEVTSPSKSPPRKKTCRCDSSDHSRTTLKKCSLYTPRCAKQKPDPPDPANQHIAPEPPGKPHTIKCKLSTIIRDPTLLQ